MADITQILRLAYQSHYAGQLEKAEQLYLEALHHDPRNVDALLLLAILTSQTSRTDAAVRLLRHAISINPNMAMLHLNLGLLYENSRDLQSAAESFKESIRLEPRSAEGYFRLGNINRGMSNHAEAIQNYLTAISLKPDYAEAHNNLGATLKDENDLKGAVESYRTAIMLKPDYAVAHNNLGVVLHDQGDSAGAAECYRRAIALKPGYATAYDNLGVALQDLDDFEEAESCGRQAVELDPQNAAAWANLGVALGQSDIGEEQRCMERAIAVEPDFAAAHWNLALTRLAQGDYPGGLPEYEWRWRGADFRSPKPHMPQPQWKGEPLNGARILLHAEQGLGDAIQMLRYVPLVALRGGEVILEIPPELHRLAATGLRGNFSLVSRGDALPPFAYHCPLMSLPLAFGTTVDTIPSPVPYLQFPAAASHHGRGLSRPSIGGDTLRVGIAWAGNPHYKADRYRSIPSPFLEPLAEIEGIRWISLQKGEAGSRPPFDMEPETSESLAGTALVIAGLDLVIAVDTAVAHLAGAMAKPLWVLLSHRPDWRWMLQREDSPWYPTARLFRQPRPRAWAEVVERLQRELRALTAARA